MAETVTEVLVETFLTLVSGIGWCIVYEECIRLGLRDKTCSMPFFALALNFAWEVIYFVGDYFFAFHGEFAGFPPIQILANGIWACLDVVILYTWFKYGKQSWPQSMDKKWFTPWSISAVVISFVIQLTFLVEFGGFYAAIYSAYLQNVVMSILFLTTMVKNGNTRGQSMLLAVAKWLGTLAPALLMGVVGGLNIYVVVMGILCSFFDVIYIGLLWNWKKQGK